MDDLFGHQSDGMPKRYHKTDWSEEQRIFEEKLPEFQRKIAGANNRVAQDGGFHEKKRAVQTVEEEPVAPSTDVDGEENADFLQDSTALLVELADVERSNCDPSTETSIPREPVMQPDDDLFAVSGGDPLKDIFNDDDDDLFPSTTAVEEPQEETVAVVEDEPVPEEPTEVAAPEPEAPKPEAPKPAPEPTVKTQTDVLKGFDREGFKDALAVVDRMLSKVDRTLNLAVLVEQLDEYEVKLSLERAREDIEVLNDGMVRVQAKADSIAGILRKLVPLANAYDAAFDYLEDVGILYANGTNRDSRIAQVKTIISEFWENKTETARIKQSYENRLKELKGQWETLSRLMTFDQYRTQYYKDVHRGERPFAPQPDLNEFQEIAEDQRKKTETLKPLGPAPALPDPDVFEQKKDAALEPAMYAELDDFPSQPEKLANRNGPKTKGEVDWQDF